MKNLKRVIVLALLAVFTSCATSNDVVSDGLFQKRKYRKGVYFEKSGANGLDKKEAIEDDIAEVIEDESNTSTEASYSAEVSVDLNNLPDEISSIEETDISTIDTEEIINSENNDFSEKSSPLNLFKDFKDVRNTFDRQPLKVRTSPEASAAAESGAMLVLLIILCLILPPVAIAIYSGITTWFWIDLLLVLLSAGFFLLPYLGGAWLAAVIIAFLVIFDVI